MNIVPRRLLVCALFLILFVSSCNLPVASPAESIGTHAVRQNTESPSQTIQLTPLIPVTGVDVVSVQCQFCVHNEAHAVLIMSNQAFFNVAEPSNGITCASAKEIDGRRILLCRGAQQASFTLNICVDASNCLQFPVTLDTCPIIPQTGNGAGPIITFTPRAPVLLTPINTLVPAASTPVPAITDSNPPPVTEPSVTEPPLPPPTVIVPLPTDGSGGEEETDVVICHIPPGNPENRRTMTVSQSEWEDEHSRHGDSLGAC